MRDFGTAKELGRYAPHYFSIRVSANFSLDEDDLTQIREVVKLDKVIHSEIRIPCKILDMEAVLTGLLGVHLKREKHAPNVHYRIRLTSDPGSTQKKSNTWDALSQRLHEMVP